MALAAVCAVLFLTFLDTTIVSVALASVQSSLSAGVVELQWVVNGYTLVFASLMLVAGSLADRWGHRRVMLVGLGVFCVGSLIAARAGSVDELIAGRAVMGIGAAGSEPATLAVVRRLYPDAGERTRAIGVWAAVSGLALALGPVIGGLLVGAWSWRAVFWFNLAAGVLLLVVAARYLPTTQSPERGRLDLAGYALSAIGLCCLVFAAISGENHGYGAWWVVALFVAGGAALAGLAAVERQAAQPMVDPGYLRVPIVRSALVVAFAVYFGVFSIFFFTALYLEEVAAYSSWRVAALFAPMAVALVGSALLTGRWTGALRGAPGAGRPAAGRGPMLAGCVVGALGIIATRALLGGTPHFAPLAAALAVAGLGFGMAVVPLTAAALDNAPARHAGMAAAMTNTMRQAGAVVGVAALGALVNAHLTTDLAARLHRLGVPSFFQAVVISAVEQGQVPSGGDAAAERAYGKVVEKVIRAAYAAFRDGLEQALVVSAVLMLLAAAYTAWSTRADHGLARDAADEQSASQHSGEPTA